MVAEWLFRILFGFAGNVRAAAMFNHRSTEEDSMRKFGLMIAALGALAIAAPSMASAETIVIKRSGHGIITATARVPSSANIAITAGMKAVATPTEW